MPPSSFFGHSKNKKDAAKKASVPPVTVHSTPASIAGSSGSSNATASKVRPRSRSHGSSHVLSQNGATTSETSSNMSAVTAKPTQAMRKLPNVFEFLEDDGDENEDKTNNAALSPSRASHFSEPTRTKPTTQRTSSSAITPIATTPNASFHVKRGVSQREASPGRSSSVASGESAEFQPATPPDVSPAAVHIGLAKEHASNQKLHLAGAYSPTDSLGSPFPGDQAFDLSVPESYYTSSREKPAQCDPPAPSQENAKGSPNSKSGKTKKNKLSTRLTSGYEYLATKLTPSMNGERTVPPLYRKFESVNHRVLLHLQDEISQMEEDLDILDKYEEMHRVASAKQEGTKPPAASRRMEAQAQSYSALHYKRMDLLGKLILKTEQYSKYHLSISLRVQGLFVDLLWIYFSATRQRTLLLQQSNAEIASGI